MTRVAAKHLIIVGNLDVCLFLRFNFSQIDSFDKICHFIYDECAAVAIFIMMMIIVDRIMENNNK